MLLTIGHGLIFQPTMARRTSNIFIVIAVTLAFGGGLFVGRYFVEKAAQSAIDGREKLLSEVERISQNDGKKGKLIAILQSSSEIDRLAVQHAQNSMAELQDELSETRQELAFYRRIVSPETKDKTLFIQKFKIIEGATPQFRLALSRGIGKKGVVKGRVRMTFKRKMAGKERELKLADIAKDGNGKLTFKFRHFRLLMGSVSFPDGFVPETVTVQIVPKSRRAKNITKNWSWVELTKSNDPGLEVSV